MAISYVTLARLIPSEAASLASCGVTILLGSECMVPALPPISPNWFATMYSDTIAMPSLVNPFATASAGLVGVLPPVPPGRSACPISCASVVANRIGDSFHEGSKLMTLAEASVVTPLPATPILKDQSSLLQNEFSAPARNGDFSAAETIELYNDSFNPKTLINFFKAFCVSITVILVIPFHAFILVYFYRNPGKLCRCIEAYRYDLILIMCEILFSPCLIPMRR
ncbi:hypothetical protein AWB67_04662 [Caballeronia terrestris]|uniref:Uncharacterized protein n=1 Tax=Caballeronia terrestris TaxID=1226301 RepID=A0A158K136_9BURK|nr:hypothetical protein AWB67_04662 [Caballeronia terrestris]